MIFSRQKWWSLTKGEKQPFSKLDPKIMTNQKKFWKSFKSFFSDKITVKWIIYLSENVKNLSWLHQQYCSKYPYPKKKFNVEHTYLRKSSIDRKRDMQLSSKYSLYQRKMKERGQPKFDFHFVFLGKSTKDIALLVHQKTFLSFRNS